MAGKSDGVEPPPGMATGAPTNFGSQNGSDAGNLNGMSRENGSGGEERAGGGSVGGSGRKPPVPLDQMRAYRACLNCRNRKSKCDLDINQGRPVSANCFLQVMGKGRCEQAGAQQTSLLIPLFLIHSLLCHTDGIAALSTMSKRGT